MSRKLDEHEYYINAFRVSIDSLERRLDSIERRLDNIERVLPHGHSHKESPSMSAELIHILIDMLKSKDLAKTEKVEQTTQQQHVPSQQPKEDNEHMFGFQRIRTIV
jgi:hypothetical protein